MTDGSGGGERTSVVEPLGLEHVIVALDGSAQAVRAVPSARELAARLGAKLAFVTVANSSADVEALRRSLAETAEAHGASAVVVESDDVPGSILETARARPSHVVGMASQGRGRSAALVGSVAAETAARGQEPLLLMGPHVPVDRGWEGGVIACVDGSERSESVVPRAASWASALGGGLLILTVAEPVPEPVRPGDPHRRRHGPPIAAEDYIGRIVDRWRGDALSVEGEVVYDPVSVVGGLAERCERQPPALVVAATHARTGRSRLVLGSVAARMVHELRSPVLVVPAIGPEHQSHGRSVRDAP